MSQPRIVYCLAGLVIMIAGVASRVFHSGIALIDHDLGEALYAALAYVLLGIVRPQLGPGGKALISASATFLIEMFQLTGVPARFAANANGALRLLAIVLGTSWSWRDLVGYAVGIAIVGLLDYFVGFGQAKPP